MSPVEAEMLLRHEDQKAVALATIKSVSVPVWARCISAASTGIGAYFLYSMHLPVKFNLVLGLVLVVAVPIGIDQWLQRRRLEAVIRLVQSLYRDQGA